MTHVNVELSRLHDGASHQACRSTASHARFQTLAHSLVIHPSLSTRQTPPKMNYSHPTTLAVAKTDKRVQVTPSPKLR